MARVIKGQAGQKQPRRQVAKLRSSGGKKVIEKEVYRAQQEGAAILAQAEEQKQSILDEAKQRAAQAREEAQAEGAQEAFETAAAEALEAFRQRALRYGEAADDIRVLALEVSRKVLGADLKLEQDAVDAVVSEGMSQLRARRKLRIQVPPVRHQALLKERPRLMATLEHEPDLVLESIGDVSAGRARIVTEPGGALCSEQVALDFVTDALSIDEQAVAPQPQSAVLELSQTDRAALVAPYEETGEVWGGLASEEQEAATDFLPSRQRVAAPTGTEETVTPGDQGGSRARADKSGRVPVHHRRSVQRMSARGGRKIPDTSDTERTMAVDVAELRRENDLPSEELDLFADDAVLE